MAFLFIGNREEAAEWQRELAARRPALSFSVWPDDSDISHACYALVWGDPGDALLRLPKLNAIFSLGAGVDHILSAPRPEEVPIIRLLDAGMGSQMADYVLHWAIHFQRDFDRYLLDQRQKKWAPRPYRDNRSLRCGILGLGVLGGRVAEGLLARGYPVLGWGRSPRTVEGVTCYQGADQLDRFLQQTELLISLLPLNEGTRGFLNRRLFERLPLQAVLLNLGRGGVLNSADLLQALDEKRLRAAVLDVFTREPLPRSDPLWHHPSIYITPHIGAKTLIAPAAEQIINAIDILTEGGRPAGQLWP